MILVIEQDVRAHNGRRFTWRPLLFRGLWSGQRTWRIGWGLWSLSYYPEPGLRDFFRWIEGKNTRWRGAMCQRRSEEGRG